MKPPNPRNTKPADQRRVAITPRVTPTTLAKLHALAESTKKSMGKLIDEAVHALFDNHDKRG